MLDDCDCRVFVDHLSLGSMKKTVLYQQHLSLGARMGEFGGWDMPIQYEGILQEHTHTRTRASIFDICHMGEFEISGPTALSDLEHLLTQNLSRLEVGQCRYGFMLNEEGGVLDDLICYRLEADCFWLVVNAGTAAGDAAWIQAHISEQTTFSDLSAQTAKIDVQGPLSKQVLEAAFSVELPQLGYFRFARMHCMGIDLLLSRTGYTGEHGYELYLPVDQAERVWVLLMNHSEVKPAGLGARDTLRLEMGFPLYGHELSERYSPVVYSGAAFIDMKKSFIGKAGVTAELGNPPFRRVALKLNSKRAAREHDRVLYNGECVGEITSGSLAPSLGVAVGLALVEPALAVPGGKLDVEIRGKTFPAEVVDLPFYTEGTATH